VVEERKYFKTSFFIPNKDKESLRPIDWHHQANSLIFSGNMDAIFFLDKFLKEQQTLDYPREVYIWSVEK
jgi:hypothetical protein